MNKIEGENLQQPMIGMVQELGSSDDWKTFIF